MRIREQSCSHGIEDLSRGISLCPDLPFSNDSHRLEFNAPTTYHELTLLRQRMDRKGLIKNSNTCGISGLSTQHMHRYVTPDFGDRRLQRLIEKLITIMEVSRSWDEFMRNLNKIENRYV